MQKVTVQTKPQITTQRVRATLANFQHMDSAKLCKTELKELTTVHYGRVLRTE